MADEVLVTEFRMTGNYTNKVNDADQATKAFIGTSMDLQSVLKSGLAIVGIGTAAFVSGGLAVAGFANEASKAAASFDTMERTFAGALGSLEKGRQMMAYLEQYAGKSAFGLDDLTNSAKQLAAVGLDVGRFLPIMERIALVASDIDPQGLLQVAGAFARIKGGSFGEAMEVFRKAGISSTDLRNQGIKVSKAGEIQASAEEVFTAVQKISEGRLKTIADSISGGAENIRANVADVAGQAFRQVGQEVNDKFLPVVVQFTDGLKAFVDSGGPKQLADAFLGFEVTATGTADALVELGGSAIRVRDAFATLGQGFAMIGKGLGDAWAWLNTPLSGNKSQPDGLDLGAAFNTLFNENADNFVKDQKERLAKLKEKGMQSVAAPTSNEAPPIDSPIAQTASNTAKLKEKGMQSVAAPTSNEAPPIDSPIAQTASNTAKMVDIAQKQLDISRQILGGGTVANEAASPVRIGQALGRGGQGSRVEQKVRELIREVYNETIGVSLASQRNSGQPNRYGVR